MPTMITRVMTFFNGQFVGEDSSGNRYYQERRKSETGRQRRWVVYSGNDEASRVEVAWHGWLHYTVQEPPKDDDKGYKWQKEHVPNLTGTAEAYRPPGHTLSRGKRDRATGDYEAWTPN